jgi:RimJ/RimL family protein N-acetyltransferase
LNTRFATLYLWDDGGNSTVESQFTEMFFCKSQTRTFLMVELLLRSNLTEQADGDIAGRTDDTSTSTGLIPVSVRGLSSSPQASSRGRPVGVSYVYSHDPINEWAYFTLALLPEAVNRGWGVAATILQVDMAFFTRNLHKLYVEIQSTNRAALRLVRWLKFEREGLFLGHRRLGGQRFDVECLAITRQRWYEEVRPLCYARFARRKQ